MELCFHEAHLYISEAAKENGGLFPSRGMLIGAGIAVVIGVGAMALWGYFM